MLFHKCHLRCRKWIFKTHRIRVAGSEDVSQTAVGSHGLKVGDTFGHWFDFGDDWWHQSNVTAIESTVPPGHYPRVVKRAGQSPPQYPDT